MLDYGDYVDTLKDNYKEGETVSFNCDNDDYIKTPKNGILECGYDDWKNTPSCEPSTFLQYTFIFN